MTKLKTQYSVKSLKLLRIELFYLGFSHTARKCGDLQIAKKNSGIITKILCNRLCKPTKSKGKKNQAYFCKTFLLVPQMCLTSSHILRICSHI